MKNLLSAHLIPEHFSQDDERALDRIQPRSIKVIEHFRKEAVPTRTLRVRQLCPNSLYVLRDHPLSEQHSDMWSNPKATGKRHADEWASKIDAWGWLGDPQIFVLGINEPAVWQNRVQTRSASFDPLQLKKEGLALVRQSLSPSTRSVTDLSRADGVFVAVDYTVSFLETLTSHGIRGGALNLSVGWPANTGPDTPPVWEPYLPIVKPILNGNHVLFLHEYWPKEGPLSHWGWLAGRFTKCPLQVPIIMGECGLEQRVVDAALPPHKWGWQGWISKEEYMAQLLEYERRCTDDKRIHSLQVFTWDFSHPFGSTDVRPLAHHPTLWPANTEFDDAIWELTPMPNDNWIDVSHHNGLVNWQAVPAEGAVIRVADGTIGKDRMFEVNWQGASQKVRAAYYFWYDHISPEEQERTLRASLGSAAPPIVFIDVEDASYKKTGLSAEDRSQLLQSFLYRISDLNPGIYTAQYTWNTHFVRQDSWKQYPLWVASWRTDYPVLPADWNHYILWQYTDKGSVPGIDGNVDRSFGKRPIDWYRENWKPLVPVEKSLLRWPCAGRITQHFGINEPDYKTPIGHDGVDISAVVGTPILAAADGIVAYVDVDPGYGNYLRVYYPEFGFYGFYAHLREVPSLKPNANVSKDQTIAYTGNTGNSTGPHLHYSVRLATKGDPSPFDPVAADPYLGTSTNLKGTVDPVLFHEWVNRWWNGSIYLNVLKKISQILKEVV